MHDLLDRLSEHLRGMWRFRRLAVIVAWAACLIGWVVVLALPPLYEASARVYVDVSVVPRSPLQGTAVAQGAQAPIGYVRQAMLSRPRLQRVARETGLDSSATTEIEREMMLDELSHDIVISRADQDETNDKSLYTISNRGPDRGRALNVVQSLVNSFVEDRLGGKATGSGAARNDLAAQVGEYEKRLADTESQLAVFTRRNVGRPTGAAGDDVARMQAENEALQKAEAALMVATERRAELSRQIRGNRSTVTGSGTAAAAPSDVALRIAETQKRLDELLLKYTDKHPDVIALRETLQQLEARQAEEHADRTRGRSSPGLMDGLSSDPVYQQIQLQISQVDAEIATLRGEVGLHQRLVAQLRTAVDSASEADAEFARLTRNYDTTKARYDELVTSLDRARIAEGAQQAGAVRFEIIDPPTLRMEPVAPNRPQLLVIVLFAGLLAGAGTAFAAHRTKPVFTGVRSLADVTGVPVLGSVSRAWFERHQFQRRSEWLRLGAATGGLVAVFALVMILADAGARLLQTIAGWA